MDNHEAKKLRILISILPFLTILLWGQVSLSFNTVNNSKYWIFVWHHCPIWDHTWYQESVPPHSTSNGWYYTGKTGFPLSVGICDYGNYPEHNSCSNDAQYGYPTNNNYSWCEIAPHGQQQVTIPDPTKPPVVSCG